MMFLDWPGAPAVLAISQPAHAWVAGQLLRAWQGGLDATLLLAAEQHDLAWLEWETRPAFDATTGRPKLFRDVGAAEHAPVWTAAVERARTAWGVRVALLISRHGSLIYTRFTDRHRTAAADAAAAADYLARQAPKQAEWARMLGVSAAALDRDTELIGFADTLSLALCGALPLPLEISGPGAAAGTAAYRLTRLDQGGCGVSPWPFAGDHLTIDLEVRPLPVDRFDNEMEMLDWLHGPERASIALHLRKTT